MTSRRRTPLDQSTRDRLVAEFDRNLVVEAGAGSGKTYSMAMRMAAGIAAGKYSVEQMAAVTFTRKAAAELRGRFKLALEERLGTAACGAERQRLQAALSRIELLFAGTIHAFCAHLLRERPVDADLAPGFVELDDTENLRRQRQAWRDYVASARASGSRPMLDLLDAGIRPQDLYRSFAAVCEHEDVEFDQGAGEPPDFESTLKRVETFWTALGEVKPDAFAADTRCRAQQKFDEFDGRLANVRRQRRLAALGSLLTFWGNTGVTAVWWSDRVNRDKSFGKRARDLVDRFFREVVDPFLAQWMAYVHRLAMQVLNEARDAYAEQRRRENIVNYVDLLRRTAGMLREGEAVRLALQRKYRWLFIDEFQDTDPVQAEIFLMLAADEAGAAGPDATAGSHGTRSVFDPFALPLRPGALFIVGDPKQSIFRFRRADIDIYTRVRQRIEDTGGEVVSLTANFRSLPEVCALANTVFPPLFARYTPPYSPAFETLDPVRDDSEVTAGPRVARLTIPKREKAAETLKEEAGRIAAFIRAEVAAKRRACGDFLVLTRNRPRLRVYAEAFDALEIPVEVSGAGLFCKSPEVRALALLLDALADPLDSVALVGVLRGPLFGLSDPELFRFRRAGGRFELTFPLPAGDEEQNAALEAQFGPALPVMRRLQGMLRTVGRLPLAAAVESILEETGWLALASTTPGGAQAGHLLQAVDRVREVVEDGGGLADAAEALNEEEASNEAEALPLRPGRRDAVRLMNLHKAKGLEAPVVFLADPGHAFEFPVQLRVVRDDGRAKGYLQIVKDSGAWRTTTVGQPAGWAAHAEEEKKYLDAERLRLLYVAGTRARELLIVCRLDESSKNKAWGEFDGYVQAMPELKVPPAGPDSKKAAPDLSAGTRAEAGAVRAAKHDRARQASWAVMNPTGAKSRLTATVEARRVAGDAAATAVPDTASHRVDAGVAWGTLIHGLLEHAMRHTAATRKDLARLALWLTVESKDLRPFIPEALDLVDAVSRDPVWHEARAAGEVCVEVPFALRIEPSSPGAGGLPVDTPTILRGVIDVAHRTGNGWRILDYKTDRIDGVTDVDTMLRARYGAQLDQYSLAWQRVTGDKVVSARFVATGAIRIREVP
jgi:ATP-dependent helicase/nuclease subunit A